MTGEIKEGERGGWVDSTELNAQFFMTARGMALRFAVDKRSAPMPLTLCAPPLSRTARRMLRQVKKSAAPLKTMAETRAPSITRQYSAGSKAGNLDD